MSQVDTLLRAAMILNDKGYEHLHAVLKGKQVLYNLEEATAYIRAAEKIIEVVRKQK